MKLNALSIFTDIRDFLFADENQSVVKVVFASLLIGLLIFLIVYAARKEKKLNKNEKIKRLVFVAIFSALSFVLYQVKFNLPMIFPGFLEIQFSNVPVLIGGFMFGPISGVAIVIVRTILKLPFSHTAGVGEFADLLIGLSVLLVTSLFYHKNKTKKNAALALLYGSITWVVVSILSNWLIIIPFYIIAMFEGNAEPLINMMSVIPGINESNYMARYLLYAVLPFNLILSTLVSLVTFLIYKRISVYIHSLSFSSDEELEAENN